MSRRGRHLIVALSRSGTGEAQVGRDIGRELRARGDEVVVVADPAVHKVFAGEDFELHVAPPEGWGAIEPVFADAIAKGRPDGVLLADFAMASNSLERRRVDPGFLAKLGGRIVFVDTWHAPEVTGLDAHPSDGLGFSPKLAGFPWRMAPVPFIRPSAEKTFCILPDPELPVERGRYGLPDDAPILFLATSAWQHRKYALAEVDAVMRAVPPVLTERLRSLPDHVHVVQLGPVPLRLKEHLGDRFHWIPNLPPQAFRGLVASVDCVLSLNASAMTNALAIASGVPVMTVVNSEAGPLGGIDVYRFLMWPYSMWDTLGPVLAGNPYGALLNPTEIRAPEAFVSTAMGLLSDRERRAEEARRRADYVQQARALPTGAALYLSHLGAKP
ncbi:MAG: hypothetical protein H6737_30025 [Alphaproteobacteria bacterium]|nr:hypothetical protein [Alphaproteobacteria bacterium]